jgi:hypothetical protein
MEKFLNKVMWIIDYYFVYFLYSSRKKIRYHIYMRHKYGKKYKIKKDGTV